MSGRKEKVAKKDHSGYGGDEKRSCASTSIWHLAVQLVTLLSYKSDVKNLWKWCRNYIMIRHYSIWISEWQHSSCLLHTWRFLWKK